MKTLISLLLVLCTFLGIIDAGFVTYEKFSGSIPPCTRGFQCETVLTSKWAMIGPVPLSMLGVLFYATFFTVNILSYLGVETLHFGKMKVPLRHVMLAFGIWGAGFSLYLISIMHFILHAWCVYCLFSATNCLFLFVLSALFWWKGKARANTAHDSSSAKDRL